MASFILREIDDELWKKFKSRAALEGLSLKDVVLNFIRDYAKGKSK